MTVGRSTPELFGNVVSLVSDLFRTELRLARTEIGEKASQAISGIVIVAVGAILLLSALFLLLGAAVDGIVTAGLSRWLSGLIVGGTIAVIGLICVLVAVGRLKLASLTPRRTLGQLKMSGSPDQASSRQV